MKLIEAVAHLLAPVKPDDFLSEWFERRPLHLPREDSSYYSRWLTVESFTRVLTTIDPKALQLKSVKNDLCLSSITLRQALDAFGDGSTIVANQLHLFDASIAELCRQLEAYFYHPFQANVYFTPAGNKGFAAHFDVHDVFVLQILGGKRWKIYQPEIELPLSEQARTPQMDPATVPGLDVALKAGDLLYLPRGYIHAAEAADDGPSLHLSLGLLGLTWRDALLMAVHDAAARDVRLRRTLPMGPHVASTLDGASRLEEVLALLSDHVRSRTVVDAQERFVLARPAVLPEFQMAGMGPPLGVHSQVRRDPLVVCDVRRYEDYIGIKFQGKSLEFPIEVTTSLDFLLTREESFTVRDIPGDLDDFNKLRMVEYLQQQGLLRSAG